MAKEMEAACRKGDFEKVKELVEQQHINPNECRDADYGKTPLHWAAHYGHLEIIQYLVENCKCDPLCRDSISCGGNTPLHWAARYANIEVVKYLVGVVEDRNCDLMCRNKRKNTPLHDAALGGQLEVVKMLINKKCDPGVLGRWGRTPLHYACEGGNMAVVKFLLESSGNASCEDEAHRTPLHIAASQGNLGVVKYLIEEQNCQVDCKDIRRETPLHETIREGRLEVMKYLISKGGDPMWGGKSGGTALHHACQHGRIEEVKYLIADNNLAVNDPCDNSGASPLHVAAVNGRLDVVKILVETFLCKLDVRDSNGQTPLELAQDKDEKEIASYLRDMDENNSGNPRSTLLRQLRPKTKKVIPTGKVLGSGAYGSVIELRWEKKIVAGKIFRTMSTAHKIAVQRSIKDELHVMMEVDHPNIVQTMGVCFLSDEPLPVLLMERMEYSLHSYFVDPNHFSLQIQTKLSILCDIANGLTCLHNHKPPIIHRDLTANNVLLDTELRAKIADFGNSQILSSHSKSMIHGTFTSLQQSREYNPFEGYEESSPSLDVFQFGHLALFTTIHTPVRPLLPPNYIDEGTGELHARSEAERRQQFVEKAEQLLSSNHSLVKLIKQCLHNNPEERPHTKELLPTLQEMMTPDIKMSSIEQQMTDMAKTELLKEKRMILPMKSGSEVDLAPGIERRDDAVRKRPTVERTLSIRGADNVGEVALQVVPGEPLDYYWEGHGLRLHIPANALDTNIPSLTMRIQASLSGQFRLPDDMELVSGVYWISFPAKSLVQPVTLELQHCARLESAEQTSLTFVTSKCNQETLPYQFEPLPGGVFTTSSDYGAVQVNHFSGVAVSRKKRRRTQSHSRKREGDTDGKTAEQSVAKKYLALTYYKRARSARPTWEMHFTVIPNLDLRMKTLEKYYPKEEVESSLRKTVAFEEEKVTLDIPEGGKYLPSGWSIVPMAYPASLTQSEVDNYEDSIPPSCQLELHLQITKQPYERLVHQIKVIGIQGISSITVTRDIDPDPELSAGAVVLGKRTHKLKGESSISTKLKSDDKPNMKDLMDALYHTVAANWEHIGIYLHFPMATLKVIATKHNSDPHKCLVEMLGVWLERVHPPATWSAIIETVEFLGEEQCGRKLREKYQL